jgi:hypothetical protein
MIFYVKNEKACQMFMDISVSVFMLQKVYKLDKEIQTVYIRFFN